MHGYGNKVIHLNCETHAYGPWDSGSGPFLENLFLYYVHCILLEISCTHFVCIVNETVNIITFTKLSVSNCQKN